MSESDSEPEEVAEPVFPESGPGREEMVSSYLPEDEDWQAKTILDVSDPAAIAALRSFDTMFPEVEELQPLIDGFLDDFMTTRTSVGGASRDEYRKIMMAMFGKGDGDSDRSTSLKLVADDDE